MTNFLDMRCPQCGDHRFIDIAATVRVRVCWDGTDAGASGDGTHHFDADSLAFCGRCGFRGTVRTFERPAAEAKEGAA
jgi:ribosomal protein S27AE